MLSSTVFQSFSCGIKNEDPMLRKGLLWEQYGKYKEPVIKNRFFKHSDIVPLIKKHAESNLFKDEILGNSVQGRSIHHLTMGTGKIKVLLWSQMHGDESTATMALFDLFNFFDAQDEHDALKKFILANLELHFVPMLNPDGAEVWQRRNALEIDLNRDFRRSVTPEARLLKELAQKLKPDFGFNLHDQSALYSAGPNRETATISFLAPAYNYEREMNDVRTRATQVILTMNNILQEKIQGRVAKYNDAHDPRCFGDNFQKNGISTILIESGGYPKDPEKQYIRKLNFYALVTALEAIAKKTYEKENLDDYDRIPENGRALYDLVIRNVVIQKKGYEFITNLGINRSQIKSTDYRSMGYRGIIEEIGDMDRTYGYDEEEASSLTFAPGKIKSMKKEEWEKLKPEDELNLIKEGYLFITWTNGKLPAGPLKDRLLNLASNPSNVTGEAGIGKPANFLLNKNGQPVYAIVNGFLLDLNQKLQVVANTIAY
jgi:hypothetical protein